MRVEIVEGEGAVLGVNVGHPIVTKGAGQLVPMSARTLPSHTQVNSYPSRIHD